MKKLFVFILMVTFLANTIVVSAWAKPCMKSSSMAMAQDMRANMDADMPCHDEEQQSQTQHCDGLCLCLPVALAQTVILNDVDVLEPLDISEVQFTISQDALVSRQTAPPRRPPKFNA